jgi:hypothetical protein
VKKARDQEQDADGVQQVNRKAGELEDREQEERERYVFGKVRVASYGALQERVAAVAQAHFCGPAILQDAQSQHQEPQDQQGGVQRGYDHCGSFHR